MTTFAITLFQILTIAASFVTGFALARRQTLSTDDRKAVLVLAATTLTLFAIATLLQVLA